MKKNFALVLMCIIYSTAISCNSVPADMFPKSVGAFQSKEGYEPWKDEDGNMNFNAKYISSDSRIISCDGFDASSEKEAVYDVAKSDKRDDANPTKPILDKNGKQIGIKVPTVRSGGTSSLRWNIGKRAYRCNSEVTEKTLEEFFTDWQSQTSK